jgi:hypothetical protein
MCLVQPSNNPVKAIFARCIVVSAMFIASVTAALAGNDTWVIHEWGTFTSLQDESGAAIGGINTDDESLPPFCHRVANMLILTPTEIPPAFFQGAPHCHPDVTMRLETPVLYFHKPQSGAGTTKIIVKASFRGGWLTEFYPNARADAPGINTNNAAFGRLQASTTGTLAWEDLEVGGDWEGPKTDAHVWTSPRAVAAVPVRTTGGEAEKFLFYRGVGRIDAPLRVSRDDRARELVLESQLASGIGGEGGVPIRSLWLVDIHSDGRLAFRDIPPVTLAGSGKVLARVASDFSPTDYRAGNLEKLKASLRGALVAEGLFDDEAQALLNTWELSYFKSAGLRIFFIVPQAWTDSYLPLRVSAPAEIDRVMVGRIELVTPEERGILQQIARVPQEKLNADAGLLWTNSLRTRSHAELNSGALSLAQCGVEVPASYELYVRLGRFRNALLLDEAARRPSPGLTEFIARFGLQGYKPVAFSGDALPNASAEAIVRSSVP